MASILNRGGLAFALIVLIVTSSSFDTATVADARNARSLKRRGPDCNGGGQSDIPGCPSSGGSSKPGPPSGPAPGSSKCKHGCCGKTKMGKCVCCN